MILKKRLSSGEEVKVICEHYHCIMQVWKNMRKEMFPEKHGSLKID